MGEEASWNCLLRGGAIELRGAVGRGRGIGIGSVLPGDGIGDNRRDSIGLHIDGLCARASKRKEQEEHEEQEKGAYEPCCDKTAAQVTRPDPTEPRISPKIPTAVPY